MQEALWRAAAFADAGADMLFIDALTSVEDMQAFCRAGGSAAAKPKVGPSGPLPAFRTAGQSSRIMLCCNLLGHRARLCMLFCQEGVHCHLKCCGVAVMLLSTYQSHACPLTKSHMISGLQQVCGRRFCRCLVEIERRSCLT